MWWVLHYYKNVFARACAEIVAGEQLPDEVHVHIGDAFESVPMESKWRSSSYVINALLLVMLSNGALKPKEDNHLQDKKQTDFNPPKYL